MTIFDRVGLVDTPLAEPHGSALAFLSDLHEQVENAINDCTEPTLRRILVDLRGRVEAAGLLVMTGAKTKSRSKKLELTPWKLEQIRRQARMEYAFYLRSSERLTFREIGRRLGVTGTMATYLFHSMRHILQDDAEDLLKSAASSMASGTK